MDLCQIKENQMQQEKVELEKSTNRMRPSDDERGVQEETFSTGSISPHANSGEINHLMNFTHHLKIKKRPLDL